MTGTCTRCNQLSFIKQHGMLELGVPYRLCANCFGIYTALAPAAIAPFMADLWQRSAAVRHA
jgi:hypothetical protein